MTHEHTANGEHHGGPEYDQSLPDADQIPSGLTPEESDLPPLEADL